MIRVMVLCVLFFNVLCTDASAFNSELTAPTEKELHNRYVMGASFLNLLTFDRADEKKFRNSEGVLVNFYSTKARTRINLFFSHGSYESSFSHNQPITIAVAGDASVADIDFDLDIRVGDLEYRSKEKGNHFDLGLVGEYELYRKIMPLKGYRLESSHAFSVNVGAGIKYDLYTKTKVYEIILDGETLDTIENPLSDSKASGIKFHMLTSINYRISLVEASIFGAFSPHDLRKSYFAFTLGGRF